MSEGMIRQEIIHYLKDRYGISPLGRNTPGDESDSTIINRAAGDVSGWLSSNAPEDAVGAVRAQIEKFADLTFQVGKVALEKRVVSELGHHPAFDLVMNIYVKAVANAPPDSNGAPRLQGPLQAFSAQTIFPTHDGKSVTAEEILQEAIRRHEAVSEKMKGNNRQA